MDKAQTQDALKDVISHLIKDDADAARQGLHDVLAAKMRDRINPSIVDLEDQVDEPEEYTDETA